MAKNLITDKHSDTLMVRKQRSGLRPMPSQRLSVSRSMNILSPTIEETAKDYLFDTSLQTASTKAATARADRSTCDSEEDVQPLSSIRLPAAGIEESIKIEEPLIQKAESRPVARLHTKFDRSPNPHHPGLRSPTPQPSASRTQELDCPKPPRFDRLTRPTSPNAQHVQQAEPASQTIKKWPSVLFEVSNNIQELHLSTPDVSKGILEVKVPEPMIKSEDIKENRISIDDFKVTEEIKIIKKHIHNTMPIHISEYKPHDELNPSPVSSSTLNPRSLGITFTLDSEAKEIRVPRRTGGSEPNLQPKSPNKPDRRISKSLYEDPKRKRNLLDWSKLPFQKDPLLRVSDREDVASLAALAQAMDTDADTDDVKMATLPSVRRTLILSRQGSSSEDQSKQGKGYGSPKTTKVLRKIRPAISRGGPAKTAISRQENRSSRTDPLQDAKPENSMKVDEGSDSKIPVPAQNMPRSYMNNRKAKQERVGSIESRPQDDVRSETLSLSDQAKAPAIVSDTRTSEGSPMKGFEIPRSVRNSLSNKAQTTKHLGSPSKISALVARFNGNSTPPPFSTKSPVKTPVSLTSGDSRNLTKSPGESWLAPYTTNESSPTRPQKLSWSEKVQQARRTPEAGEQTSKPSLLGDTIADSTTPKRILRSSLNDPTPLRPIRTVAEMNGSSSVKSSPRASMPSRTQLARKSVEYQIKKSVEGFQEPKPIQNIIKLPKEPVPKFFEDSFTFSRQLESAKSPLAGRRPTQDSIDPGSVSPRKRSQNLSSSTSGSQMYFQPPKSFRSALETVRAASPVQSLVDVPAFDGPGSIDSSAERVHSQHKRLSVIQPVPTLLGRSLIFDKNADAADFVHPDSPFKETFTYSNPGSPRSSPPLRRESVLHSHIKSLQQQIAEKTKEINHLKSQMEILRTVAIKRLGEELLDARKDAELWKSRAKAAESNLEAMTPRNALKRRTTVSSVKRASPLRSSTESSTTEGAQLADKIRQALGGMDGPESSRPSIYESDNTTLDDDRHSRRWNSDESTGTVLREMKQRFNGSEYGS